MAPEPLCKVGSDINDGDYNSRPELPRVRHRKPDFVLRFVYYKPNLKKSHSPEFSSFLSICQYLLLVTMVSSDLGFLPNDNLPPQDRIIAICREDLSLQSAWREYHRLGQIWSECHHRRSVDPRLGCQRAFECQS